jgi:hypothetical protein
MQEGDGDCGKGTQTLDAIEPRFGVTQATLSTVIPTIRPSVARSRPIVYSK